MADYEVITDYRGRAVRLTEERWAHILAHPEMAGQRERLIETLVQPDLVIATVKDEMVHTYHRLYESTPVTRKFLVVAVKMERDDAFVLTAYFTSRVKKRKDRMAQLKVWYDREGDYLEVIFEEVPATLERYLRTCSSAVRQKAVW